jgi:hypothetical protein
MRQRELAVSGQPRLRDRLAVRLRSGKFDRALAGGRPSESSAALALRARQLVELSSRRSIAESLRRLATSRRGAQAPTDPRILPDRAAVAGSRAELQKLADALVAPGPVAVRGVAQARILLTDGTGPLYDPRGGATVGAEALSAIESLALPEAAGARGAYGRIRS